MSTKSLALTLVRKGVLELRTVLQDERLRSGQLLVQVEYSSVQPLDGDMFMCAGQFQALDLPHVMGVEGVGVVLKSASEKVPEGARVAFLLRKFFNDERHGSWQKRLVLDEQRALILSVPAVVGLNQVAACITSTVAALAFLKPFPPKSQIIVTGACGSVGLAAVQLGALMGHKMVAFVRGEARASWLAKELAPCGFIAVVDTTAPEWEQLATYVCNKGFLAADDDACGGADGIIDGIGGDVLTLAAQQLIRVRGIVVRFAGEEHPDPELQDAVGKFGLQVLREGVESFMQTKDVAEQVQAAFAWIGERYRPKAWHVASWSEAAECMKEQPTWTRYATQMKSGRIGRIILKFD